MVGGPVCNEHVARQQECDGARKQTEHKKNTSDKLKGGDERGTETWELNIEAGEEPRNFRQVV